ncbi:hypothetical protein [Emticicia aquatica]|nr:hypothetical protein [Emticicia aquatica]
MKNIIFITAIFLVLVCECYAQVLENKNQADLWSNNFRIVSYFIMGFWYYDKQKENFGTIQKVFLISIFIPIAVSLSSYLIDEKIAIIVNISVNSMMFASWVYVFKQLGAFITFKDSNRTIIKLMPAFLVLPMLFFYFSLYQSLPLLYSIFVFSYIIFFSYTGLLAGFLPIKEEKKLWIIIAIVILVIVNFMNGYHTFLQKLSWAYPVIRTLTVTSRCMMIYGMINYNEQPTQGKQ